MAYAICNKRTKEALKDKMTFFNVIIIFFFYLNKDLLYFITGLINCLFIVGLLYQVISEVKSCEIYAVSLP